MEHSVVPRPATAPPSGLAAAFGRRRLGEFRDFGGGGALLGGPPVRPTV